MITTITMHEEGKTVEAAGGMVLTTDSWLTAPIAAMKDAREFDRRYFEKVSGMDAAAAAQQMAGAMAMFPGSGEALRARVSRARRLEGTAIMTTMTVDTDQEPRADDEGIRATAGFGRGWPGRDARPQDGEEEAAGERRRSGEPRQRDDDDSRIAERVDRRPGGCGRDSGGLQG